MTSTLEAKLARFEKVLRASGAAVAPLLRPGIDEANVRARLGEIDLEPTSELITWFQWHDGAGEAGVRPAQAIEVVPGGEFYWLGYLCGEYTMIRGSTAYVASDPVAVLSDEELWSPTWFPLLRLLGKGALAVDLESSADEGRPFTSCGGIPTRPRGPA